MIAWKKAQEKVENWDNVDINDDTDIPQDLIDKFLRNSRNKMNLTEFLSKIIDLHQRTKYMVATYKDKMLRSTSIKHWIHMIS